MPIVQTSEFRPIALPDSGEVPLSVQFSVPAGVFPPLGEISWTIGDTVIAKNQQVVFTFDEPGTHTAQVVIDAPGNKLIGSVEVTVVDQDPVGDPPPEPPRLVLWRIWCE